MKSARGMGGGGVGGWGVIIRFRRILIYLLVFVKVDSVAQGLSGTEATLKNMNISDHQLIKTNWNSRIVCNV